LLAARSSETARGEQPASEPSWIIFLILASGLEARRLGANCERPACSPCGLGADVARLRADQLADAALLDHVRAPAGGAADAKRGRELLARQTDGVEEHGGVELDVRGERPVRLALAEDLRRGLLDGVREHEALAREVGDRVLE